MMVRFYLPGLVCVRAHLHLQYLFSVSLHPWAGMNTVNAFKCGLKQRIKDDARDRYCGENMTELVNC